MCYDSCGLEIRNNKSPKEKIDCPALENAWFLAAVDDRVSCQKLLTALGLSSSVLGSQMANSAQKLGIPGTVLYERTSEEKL